MNKPLRLVLWANDSPRNAVDGVCEVVVEDIERYLSEAEEDSCFVNDLVAYVRCLTGVYDWAGGEYQYELTGCYFHAKRKHAHAAREKAPRTHWDKALSLKGVNGFPAIHFSFEEPLF